MATRKPPTLDEIADALAKHEQIQAGCALWWPDAVDHLRRQLRTTARNAGIWMQDAVEVGGGKFELVNTSYDKITHVQRGSEWQMLNAAGYAGQDMDCWPLLSPSGGRINERRGGASKSQQYIIMSEALRTMVNDAAEYAAQQRDAARLRRTKSREAAEAKHGQSLAYIRGLLRAADAGPDQVDGVLYDFKTDRASLGLIFIDGAIERIAGVLAAFGIEPDPPAQILTRKPEADLAVPLEKKGDSRG